MLKKKLVIISGVTGALGNALLAGYGKERNTVIYGISRQAIGMANFLDEQSGKFHDKTFICCVGEGKQEDYQNFIKFIDFDKFLEVIYIHALGVYPFEVDNQGNYLVKNDHDGDGIDDRCMNLTYNIFRFMIQSIIDRTILPVKCIIFGGLPDVYKPKVHWSWWQTIDLVKRYMRSVKSDKVAMYVLNISSVMCSHELLTRPYLFINTDADSVYYLTPREVAKKVIDELKDDKFGYYESDLFHPAPNFSEDYYNENNFKPRKMAELYKQVKGKTVYKTS